MKHSSYKNSPILRKREKKRYYEKRKERKKHHFPMVNKKIAEMLVVCLPCHFDMGILPYHRARGTPLAVLYDTHVLTMTRTYTLSRDMRTLYDTHVLTMTRTYR